MEIVVISFKASKNLKNRLIKEAFNRKIDGKAKATLTEVAIEALECFFGINEFEEEVRLENVEENEKD